LVIHNSLFLIVLVVQLFKEFTRYNLEHFHNLIQIKEHKGKD